MSRSSGAALKAGAGKPASRAKVGAERHRLPAIYRRHHRASPRARCCCTATCWPTSRRTLLWMETPSRSSRSPAQPDLHLRAAALSHLRADGERADGHAAGRPQHPDPQPARHSRLRQGTGTKYPIHIFPGLNTLFNALLNNQDFRKLDFKPLMLDAAAAAWRCRRRVAERWKAVTGCRSPRATACPRPRRWRPPTASSAGAFTGTIGLPIPSTEIAIRDDDGNSRAARRGRRNLHPRARR